MSRKKMSYREAIREALRKAMAEDERVFLLGEDVGAYGGCYGVSMGLLEEFGAERIRNTPLSENSFVGAAIGAALGGMRPIVEVMTINFLLLALDQIVNNAATIRHMSGGQFAVPLVVRMATGAGRQVAAQHSNSFEGWLAHIPGIKILSPATVADSYGMLLAALRDPNPTLLCEHATLYNRVEEVDLEVECPPCDRAARRREGGDLTIVAYSAMVHKALEAAEELSTAGVEAEVIDLRSLRPLDEKAILSSLAKTHRVLIVDEGWKSGSLSAEIAARVCEKGFYDLDAPPVRVCSKEVPIPYAKHLEEAAIPQVETIVDAAKRMVGRDV